MVDCYRLCWRAGSGRAAPWPTARPCAGGRADAVSLVRAVEVPRRPVSMLEPVVGVARYELLAPGANLVRHMLAGPTVWNVNLTATGGGVAEMLQVLVGYIHDLDIRVGWLVIPGDAGSSWSPSASTTVSTACPETRATSGRRRSTAYGRRQSRPTPGPCSPPCARATSWFSCTALRSLSRPRAGGCGPGARGRVAAPRRNGAGERVDPSRHGRSSARTSSLCVGFRLLASCLCPGLTRPRADLVEIIPPSIDPFSPKNEDGDPVHRPGPHPRQPWA